MFLWEFGLSGWRDLVPPSIPTLSHSVFFVHPSTSHPFPKEGDGFIEGSNVLQTSYRADALVDAVHRRTALDGDEGVTMRADGDEWTSLRGHHENRWGVRARGERMSACVRA